MNYKGFITRLSMLDIGPLKEHNKHRCLFRHDIDMDFNTAYRMAVAERNTGIYSTYYVLPAEPYYKEKDFLARLKKMQDMGHEIGLHNNLITRYIQDKINVKKYLKTHLDHLRDNGIEIVGVAAHGDKLCRRMGYNNGLIFEDGWNELKLDPKDFGLEYDAYQLGHEFYFTDSRGSWKMTEYNEWHPEFMSLPTNSVDQIIEEIMKKTENKLQINTHPCYWRGKI